MVMEGGCDITRISCPESDGRSPRFRFRVTILDVLRNLVPGESPDSNLGLVPEGSKNTAITCVEGRASTSFAVGKTATRVAIQEGVACGRGESSGKTLGRAVRALVQGLDVRARVAAVAGMESALVGRVVVDVFNYVDL